MPQPSVSRAALAFIFVTVTLDMLAIGIMVPVLPMLLLQMSRGDVGDAARMTGLFALTWASMQFLCSPLVGALSDRFGRRPVILMSNLGLGLDYLLMATAPSLFWLWCGRVLSGITAASYSAATAYIADVTPEHRRAEAFGWLGAAFGLGFVVGPALGGTLGAIHTRLPFWVAAGLSLINTLYGACILPESLPPALRSRRLSWAQINPTGGLRLLSSQPVLLRLGLALGLGDLAHHTLPSLFVLYADTRFGWDARTVGWVIAASGIAATLVSAAGVGPLVRRLGEARTVAFGLACGAAGFACYGLAPTGPLFLWGLPLLALWGLAGPILQAVMTRHVAPSAQGQMQGALSSIHGMAGMAGPPLFTQMFSAALAAPPPWHQPGVPFLVAGVCLFCSIAVVHWGLEAATVPARADG